VVAQDTVQLRAEPFDGAPALAIEEVRAKFDCNALELLEGMSEQQEFAFGIDRRAMHALAIPRRADLQAAIDGIDVHVGRHSDRATTGVQHRERQHGATARELEPSLDFRS